MRHQLVGLLGGGIQCHGMVNGVGFGERHISIQPIDARRTGIDEMTYPRMPATFQNAQETFDVAVRVNSWMTETMPHTCLCRKIDDAVKPLVLHEGDDEIMVCQIRP